MLMMQRTINERNIWIDRERKRQERTAGVGIGVAGNYFYHNRNQLIISTSKLTKGQLGSHTSLQAVIP